MISEVDHWWGLGLGLGRGELRQRPVGPCGIEMVQVDRKDLAQVAFVDDQILGRAARGAGFRSCVRRSRSLGVLRVD
ncbi:MAG: hypothetical protein M3325_06665 [Actinomycetota bacterium]|nr:hypothetical protein [Actinomycetota bacterium]